jgi:Spy/CpxP family protein refolding chaperone
MKRLDDKLDLTDAQWAGMEVIVRQTQEETAKIFKDQGKKVHSLMERDMEAFKKILNTDQQQKLEELHRKFEERRKKRDKD